MILIQMDIFNIFGRGNIFLTFDSGTSFQYLLLPMMVENTNFLFNVKMNINVIFRKLGQVIMLH